MIGLDFSWDGGVVGLAMYASTCEYKPLPYQICSFAIFGNFEVNKIAIFGNFLVSIFTD